jgi:HD domain
VTAESGGQSRPPVRRTQGTTVYVGLVAALGIGLTTAAVIVQGLVIDGPLVVLGFLAVLTWWSGRIVVASNVSLTFSSIVLLAAMALLGPAGAGIVGILLGPLQRGKVPLRGRVFNTGMSATLGVLGGWAYLAAGGELDSSGVIGAWDIARQIAIPILVADVVQVAVNLVLLAGVIRAAGGAPMRNQMLRLLGSTGPAYLGYGAIAFLLVVLWQPAGVGPASVALILPPLVVAQWAYLQYAEEFKAHERALHVLVAAVEAKAPHLTGHSARVAQLSARMAEHLGLRGQVVDDTRVAGMLHDLGQTTLPTPLVRGGESTGGDLVRSYPARGAELLRDLSFLSGSLDAISRHRDAHLRAGAGTSDDLPARIVGLADEYDLLTEVGTPDGAVLEPEEALRVLGDASGPRRELVGALEQALGRTGGAGA